MLFARLALPRWQARVSVAASFSSLSPPTPGLTPVCLFNSTSLTVLLKAAVSECHPSHTSSGRFAAKAIELQSLVHRVALRRAQHPRRRLHPARLVPVFESPFFTKATVVPPAPRIHQAASPTRSVCRNQIRTKMRSTRSSWLLTCSIAIQWAAAITSHEMRSSISWRMCVLEVPISWMHVGCQSALPWWG